MSDYDEEIMILEKMKKRRQCDNQNEDRLSDLPDNVLLHILSSLNTKQVVQTCVLSKRWKHLWKFISTLMLHCSTFSTVEGFATFVSKILTLRDTSIAPHALDLNHCGEIEYELLIMVLDYVFSHNAQLQELEISVNRIVPIMSCVSSCHALTSRKLSIYRKGSSLGHNHTPALFRGSSRSYNRQPVLSPKSLNLPLLTSLDLTNFAFRDGKSGCVEPFSVFTKLNSLVIRSCMVFDAQMLSISSETLVNLAIHRPLEIMNLTIQNNSSGFAEIKLITPNLCTFNFTGDLINKICGSGLAYVKQVNIDVSRQFSASAAHGLVLFSWLHDFANVESLTITSTTLQILSLVPDLLEIKLSSLCNLKSLEVELIPLHDGSLSISIENAMLNKAAAKSRKAVVKLRKAFKARLEPPAIPDGIVDFLRQNSPSAEVNIKTDYPNCFNLKQVEESIKSAKIVKHHSRFVVPGISSTAPAEKEPLSAIYSSKNCLRMTIEDDKSSNEDKVEKHQPNTNSPLLDIEQ
ncbi:hypothetical protein TSUD_65120 [Trifolium subterraneum]|uniref:F-box domain-containing protein n=1 Tax=Trifolium subterraneum TaxID=3900 RepID=A0A2Z6NID6_TRISU|nr:hypothetical protein TSUD_65120 [Trifolium subterraneum]